MIYFDNAATTIQKPPCVGQAVSAAMTTMGNPGRGAHEAALAANRTIYQARKRLAELFHAEYAETIVFTSNSTEALNIAVKGTIEPGDHVITTVLEHNSVLRPLYEMEEKGCMLSVIGADACGTVRISAIEQAVRENTKAIVITHGSNYTGNIVDIRAVGEIARKHGIVLIVDASQTAGYADIDVQKMNIDILCFTGHKSLLGPQGTGGMYVSPGITVKPLKTGGSGIKTFEHQHPQVMPAALEAGTLNGHGIAGLSAAVSFLQKEGLCRIREKETRLMRMFYQGVRDLDGVTVYGDFRDPDSLRCPIVMLNINKEDSGRVADILYQDYEIAVRAGGHCAPLMHEHFGTRQQGAVRFSFSYFNTEEEIETAVTAVREIARDTKIV